MLRPIDGEGISRYSTGRPGLENAPAVADSPTAPTRPDSRAAPVAATASRRGKLAVPPRTLSNFSKNDISPTHPNSSSALRCRGSRSNLFWASETQGDCALPASRPESDVAVG